MANSINAASFSSSSSRASSSTSGILHDVFISHRGPDVKKTFASYLYKRLCHFRLRVFLDKDELEKGDAISSQIERAIDGASVQIAILSPTYADSAWCLNELVLMKKSGAFILPIFFKVDPSKVRHTEKNGEYAKALKELEGKRTSEEKPRHASETIQNWREALSYVADLSGFVHRAEDDEGELLENVVEKVLEKVPKTPLDVPQYPTGLDTKLQDFINSVLSQESERVGTKVLGIVGIGGVGKTTLAKIFFNSHGKTSFLSNVREAAARDSLSSLQTQLIRDLLHTDQITVDSHNGIELFKRHLNLFHAWIVLDDVDDIRQLDAFLPLQHILSPHSLILITSRNKRVLLSSGVSEQSIYHLKGLDTVDSQKLFCFHAFHKPLPPPEFADLVDRFVKACDGLPLSLKDFGAKVCGVNERSVWEEMLEELEKTLPDEIYHKLRISYDSLSPKDKEIFLDIACFFLGENGDKAMRIWGKLGFRQLQDRCLVEVDENEIKMHDQIRDMGRKIAEEGSLPLRLWDCRTNNIDDWLEPTRINEVRGIKIIHGDDVFRRTHFWDWYSKYQTRHLFSKGLETRHLSFSKGLEMRFRDLRLVAAEEDYLEDVLKRVQPPRLIWLRWYGCNYSSLPDWIPMKNLRVLEVEGSILNKLWPHQSLQGVPLRELNICAPLSEIPKSIGELKNLERIAICSLKWTSTLKRLPDECCNLESLKYLVLKGLTRMALLPHRFGELMNLQLIDWDDAASLQMLPSSFGKLTQLKHLSLTGASSLEMLPNSFGNLTGLSHLCLSRCTNLIVCNSTLGNITMLEYLDLSYCEQVKELPTQIANQRALRTLDLTGTKLKEIPSYIGDLSNLEYLRLGSDLLEVLPPGLGDLKSLKTLALSSSPQLKSLPPSIGLLTQLTELQIDQCGIEYLPRELLKMNNLEKLSVLYCPLRDLPFRKLVEGEGEILLLEGEREFNKSSCYNDRCLLALKTLQLSETKLREVSFDEGICPNLQQLTLTGCKQIGGLSGLETLTSLQRLDVTGCEKLHSIRGLGQLSKLTHLNVHGCFEIQELPGVERFTSLEYLTVWECEKLESIQGLGQLTNLIELNVYECKLQSIPGLGKLRKLIKLNVHGCWIRELPGVEHSTSLEKLDVGGCEKLQRIPGLPRLTKLIHLNVHGCCEIRELPGVEQLTSLETLDVGGCKKLHSIKGLGQLTKLTHLDLGCLEIQELPGVERLTSLEYLNVCECEKLQSIQSLGQLTNLIKLDVHGCKLQSIPGLGQLTNLTQLDVHGCPEILELQGVEHLSSLTRLDVGGCKKLQSIRGLGQLTQMREVNVSECYELAELAGVEDLMLLEILNARDCPKLQLSEGVVESLRQQLNDGFIYERPRKRFSCLQFLPFRCMW